MTTAISLKILTCSVASPAKTWCGHSHAFMPATGTRSHGYRICSMLSFGEETPAAITLAVLSSMPQTLCFCSAVIGLLSPSLGRVYPHRCSNLAESSPRKSSFDLFRNHLQRHHNLDAASLWSNEVSPGTALAAPHFKYPAK